LREPEVGTVVRCRSTDYAAALGVAGLGGVVLEPRSAHSLVFFAERGSSYWIPNGALAFVEVGSAPALLGLLSRLLRLLEATEVQVETVTPERLVLTVNHGPLALETILAIRDLTGPALESLSIQPGGMAFMTATVAIRRAGLEAPRGA
jgi:hypothetical protein